MRYHTEKPIYYSKNYGEIFYCNHPVYSEGTLFRIGKQGIIVIQQRYDPETKHTWWGSIDEWLNDLIFLNPNFRDFFLEKSSEIKEGRYPTYTVRQVMWSLKMKPLKKEPWETVFDRNSI